MQYFDDHFPKITFFFNLTKCLIAQFSIGSTTDQKGGIGGLEREKVRSFFSKFFFYRQGLALYSRSGFL